MTKTILCALAIAFALPLAAPSARADEAPPPKKEAAKKAKADAKKDPEEKKKSGKAKIGEACKTADDCDQSERDAGCVEGKCKAVMVHPVT